MMQKRVISLAVPAVVLMARKGGIGLVDLLTPSKSRMLPPLRDHQADALAAVVGAAAAEGDDQSHSFFLYTFTPSWTFLSVGFGTVSSKITGSTPASFLTSSAILSVRPAFVIPLSVTMRGFFPPAP